MRSLVPVSETILPSGSGALVAVADRGDLLRDWASRRDKRAPSGLLSMAAVLAGSVPWALLGGSNNADSESTSVCRITSRKSSIPCP
jgi:hypothetical protein